MQEEIEISPYGNMLMYKKGYSPKFVHDTIERLSLAGLRIFDHLDRLENLDFLREYTFLKKLDIDCINDHDFSFLKSMEHLLSLGIGISTTQNSVIDLVCQKNLLDLSIQWRKGKVLGLEECTNLRSLCVVDFNETDFSMLSSLYKLQTLTVRSSNVKSANGMDKLIFLEEISFGNCKKMKSVGAINGNSFLKKLELEDCPSVNDYKELTNLPKLETILISNCKGIDSIGFILNFPLLRKLSLLGNTVVLDGNLKPAQKITEFIYKHQDYYNISIKNKEYDENVKKNKEKLRGLFDIGEK